VHQFRFRIRGRDASQLLESAALLAEELLQLLLPLDYRLFAARDGLHATGVLALTLLEQIVLAIELAFAVLDAALLALDFFAAAPDLDLPVLAELHQLFLAAQDRGLAQTLRLSLGVAEDAPGGFIGGGFRLLLPFQLGAGSEPPSDIEKNRAGNNKQKDASCG
jgi:hypothetical protein